MAFAKVDFFSQSLKRVTTFYALIPNDSPDLKNNGPFKTLYLLHGYSGGNADWLLNSAISDLSNRYNLAVIMPSGENSFYLDSKGTGKAYGQFTGCELVDYTRRLFNLSKNREDTFTGGLSMGGFGALHTAIKYNRTFGKTFALSSALIINGIKNMKEGEGNGVADYDYYYSTFGDLTKLDESENNPEFLVKSHLKAGEPLPEIYMSCGTEDFLLEANREFKAFLEKSGVPFEYTEAPGVHDWYYWNAHLEPALKWLTGGKANG